MAAAIKVHSFVAMFLYAPTMKYRALPVCRKCVFVCVFVCMFQNCVLLIVLSCIMGFENNLAQMIIMTRQCIVYNNHVDRSKFKITVHTQT